MRPKSTATDHFWTGKDEKILSQQQLSLSCMDKGNETHIDAKQDSLGKMDAASCSLVQSAACFTNHR